MKIIITMLVFGLFAVPTHAQTTEDSIVPSVADQMPKVISENLSSSDTNPGVMHDPIPDVSDDTDPVVDETLSTSNVNPGVVAYDGGGDIVSGGENTDNNGNSGGSGSKKKGKKSQVIEDDIFGMVLGSAVFSFTNNLREGMSGQDVVELQKELRAEGFFTFPTDTGYFGPITKAAVMEYQKSRGIWTTGFVGPITRAALNRVF